MSSPSDRRHHKPATGGPSDKGGHKPRPFDDVVLDYEKFVSGERIRCRGEEAVVVYQREVYRPSTTGRTEVRSDQGESAKVFSSMHHGVSKGVASRIEERDDSSLAPSEGLEDETESSLFPSLVITRGSLVDLVHTFHLFRGHNVLTSREVDSSTHPPRGYMAISQHYFFAGLRFTLPRFLIRLLNLLGLMPMQLTSNAYS
ncbi:hypothetical protein ACOSQ3_031460 [Xanthoceras sorbifolium]